MSALPIAANRELGTYVRRVIRAHLAGFGLVTGLQALGVVAGLFVPWLLGDLVVDVSAHHDTVARIVALILVFLTAQAVLARLASYASAALGEKILATLREDFMTDVLALPPEIIEDAEPGDLITRTSRDVGLLSTTVRAAVPQSMTAVGTVLFTVGAMALVSPLLVLPCLLSVPLLFSGSRWYLRRAHAGYLREASSYSQLTEGLAETVEGARTVEALRLTARRMDRVTADMPAPAPPSSARGGCATSSTRCSVRGTSFRSARLCSSEASSICTRWCRWPASSRPPRTLCSSSSRWMWSCSG